MDAVNQAVNYAFQTENAPIPTCKKKSISTSAKTTT